MENIELTRTNGLRYTDAVRDRNPIHQTDEEAKKYGFERTVVPGMWLASHIQSRSRITEIKQIRFSGILYYGDFVSITETPHRVGKGKDIGFRRGDAIVCSISGVKIGDYSSNPKLLKEIVYNYTADACEERINLFLNSIGYVPQRGNLPEMYVASLCAPALLDYGSRKGLLGIHTSLSFNMHSNYKPGEIILELGDVRTKGPMSFIEILWKQNERVIASGRAGVSTMLSKDLEERLK